MRRMINSNTQGPYNQLAPAFKSGPFGLELTNSFPPTSITSPTTARHISSVVRLEFSTERLTVGAFLNFEFTFVSRSVSRSRGNETGREGLTGFDDRDSFFRLVSRVLGDVLNLFPTTESVHASE